MVDDEADEMDGLGRAFTFVLDDARHAHDRRIADEWRRLHDRPDADRPTEVRAEPSGSVIGSLRAHLPFARARSVRDPG